MSDIKKAKPKTKVSKAASKVKKPASKVKKIVAKPKKLTGKENNSFAKLKDDIVRQPTLEGRRKIFDSETVPESALRKLRATKYTDEDRVEFLEYVKKANGFVTVACDAFGVSAQTLSNWKVKHPEFKENLRKVIDECEDKKGDFVESALMRNIGDGKEQSIFFYLRNKQKSRGYMEKSEQYHRVEQVQPIQIDISPAIDKDED